MSEPASLRKKRIVVGLAAASTIAVVGAALLLDLQPEEVSSREVEPPPLAVSVEGCPEQQPDSARHHAVAAEAAARAKEERQPFSRRDGVEALRLYAEAQGCYAAVGAEEDARRVQAELERWSAFMNDEYASLRLRLRLALDQKRFEEALSAARAIEVLLSAAGSDEDPYRGWLGSVRRELERKVSRQKR